jgi:hypothetical protein
LKENICPIYTPLEFSKYAKFDNAVPICLRMKVIHEVNILMSRQQLIVSEQLFNEQMFFGLNK